MFFLLTICIVLVDIPIDLLLFHLEEASVKHVDEGQLLGTSSFCIRSSSLESMYLKLNGCQLWTSFVKGTVCSVFRCISKFIILLIFV